MAVHHQNMVQMVKGQPKRPMVETGCQLLALWHIDCAMHAGSAEVLAEQD
jgi:hypothetical protein